MGMKEWVLDRRGFTIVELLIVIVVIAILAVITIVAYNGIQNRAKDSAVQSAALQAGKKVLSYAPLNADAFPLETTFRQDLGLPQNTTQLTYDYFVTDTRKAFCMSVADTTKNPEVAYSFTQDGKIVGGRCVKNLITNPNFNQSGTGWSVYQTAIGERQATGGVNDSGRFALRKTSTATDALAQLILNSGAVVGGASYAVSYWVWGEVAQSTQGFSGVQENTNTWRQIVTLPTGTVASTSPVRRSITGVAMSDVLPTTRFVLRASNSDSVTLFYDNVMLTAGSVVYSYGDGDQPNWSWSGSAGTSTSFGPAVPSSL